jgi:hypothetical protein
MTSFTTPKGTELPVMDLKGKPYLQVAHRIQWFREDHPDWSITTELKTGSDFCLAKAEIKDVNGKVIASAHKQETKVHFADFIEKAETGSIGRALANCGYGTQFALNDLDEGDRLADAPVNTVVRSAPVMQSAPTVNVNGFAVSPAISKIIEKQASQNPIQIPNEADKLKGLKKCSEAQVRRFHGVARSVNMPPQVWLGELQTRYGHQDPAQLDWKQYKDFVDGWMVTWKNHATPIEPSFLDVPLDTMQPMDEEIPF